MAGSQSPSKVSLHGKSEGASGAQKTPIQNEFGWGMGLDRDGWGSRRVTTMMRGARVIPD